MIVLVTGITGLVGCHAAMRLLERGHSVVAVARRRNGVPADQRVRRILEACPEFGSRFGLAGLHVIEGDILQAGCGMTAATRNALKDQIDVAIHCAGEVSFGPAMSVACARTNTDGAGNVGEWIREIGCPRLVHVGTAYAVRGAQRFRTPYEESKFLGEKQLRETADRAGIDLRIVRPSIVTGDTVHGFTPTYHGIYPFLKYAADYAHDLKRVSPTEGLPPGFVPEAKINLVPADVVAEVLCEAACAPRLEEREFNVINPEPWVARELGILVASHAGIGADVFSSVGPAAPLSAAALGAVTMLQEAYAPYFDVDLDVKTESTDRLMESAGIARVRNTPEWIAALLAWGLRQGWKEIG